MWGAILGLLKELARSFSTIVEMLQQRRLMEAGRTEAERDQLKKERDNARLAEEIRDPNRAEPDPVSVLRDKWSRD